jgi:hypothetical protein
MIRKFRTMLFLSLAAGLLLLSASVASAQQWNLDAATAQKYRNNPCADPRISWALWNESAGFTKPQGGYDCDPSNYDFSTVHKALDMDHAVRDYRSSLRSHSVTISSISRGPNNQASQTIRDGRSGAWVTLAVGVISNDSATVVSSGGGNVIAQGGGNVIAQGGGNFRGVLAAGDKIIQLPGKWFRLH